MDGGNEALRIASALFWEGAFAEALAVLAPLDEPVATLLKIECLLFDRSTEEAQRLLLAHDPALRALTGAGADLDLIDGLLALDQDELVVAKAAFQHARQRSAASRPMRAATSFCLASIAHRQGELRVARGLLERAIEEAGPKVFVKRWASAELEKLGDVAPRRARRGALAALAALALVALAFFIVSFTAPASSVSSAPARRRHRTPVLDAREQNERVELAFAHADVLHAAEGALREERSGVIDLYFVGAAGWAQQDVFLRELRSARAVLDDHFDTRGRSLLLANDPSARGELAPAATVTLRRALKAVGARMNREEDVLFLYLTSHGSAGGLALGFAPNAAFRDETLTPPELRSMLDESGVKWRVIVIAGCESGTFVAPLATDESLVATAAASDRVSYGCASGNAYTDFGRALFEKWLPTQKSIPLALTHAIATVAAEESARDAMPSRPQLHQGAAIGEKLARLERQRRLPVDKR